MCVYVSRTRSRIQKYCMLIRIRNKFESRQVCNSSLGTSLFIVIRLLLVIVLDCRHPCFFRPKTLYACETEFLLILIFFFSFTSPPITTVLYSYLKYVYTAFFIYLYLIILYFINGKLKTIYLKFVVGAI